MILVVVFVVVVISYMIMIIDFHVSRYYLTGMRRKTIVFVNVNVYSVGVYINEEIDKEVRLSGAGKSSFVDVLTSVVSKYNDVKLGWFVLLLL